MNKFIFKIELGDDWRYSLMIDIIQLDNRFISDSRNLKSKPFCYFEDSKKFYIYSQNEGYVFEDGLEIPEYRHLFDETGKFVVTKISHNFYDEDKRYTYLKSLYRCLTEWSNGYNRFKDDNDNIKSITLSNEYWII